MELTQDTTPDAMKSNGLAARLWQSARRHSVGHAHGQLVWRCWGQGEPLVLLHGSHGGWMHWVRNIEELAKHRLVIAPDLPGFGESDAAGDVEDVAAHAAILADALRLMSDGQPVDIAAFSLGALFGCHLAQRVPDLVRRLVLIDAGGLDTPMHFADFRPTRGTAPSERREINRHNLGAMMLHDPASIDDLAIDISMHYGPLTRTRVQFHVIPDKLLHLIRGVRQPIDLIWGEHDFPHPDPELNAAAVRRYHPEARLRVIEGAGHWCMYEAPEACNSALLDLLSPGQTAGGQVAPNCTRTAP